MHNSIQTLRTRNALDLPVDGAGYIEVHAGEFGVRPNEHLGIRRLRAVALTDYGMGLRGVRLLRPRHRKQ